MIHRPLLLLATLGLAIGVAAQTSPVKGTGCPNAPYPAVTNAKINQTATVTIPKTGVLEVPVMILGNQTGNKISLGPPFACAKGCVLYTQLLSVSILPRGTTSVKLKIPNDIRLWRSCFGVQTAAGRITGCVYLHGSLTFCIGR